MHCENGISFELLSNRRSAESGLVEAFDQTSRQFPRFPIEGVGWAGYNARMISKNDVEAKVSLSEHRFCIAPMMDGHDNPRKLIS